MSLPPTEALQIDPVNSLGKLSERPEPPDWQLAAPLAEAPSLHTELTPSNQEYIKTV